MVVDTKFIDGRRLLVAIRLVVAIKLVIISRQVGVFIGLMVASRQKQAIIIVQISEIQQYYTETLQSIAKIHTQY